MRCGAMEAAEEYSADTVAQTSVRQSPTLVTLPSMRTTTLLLLLLPLSACAWVEEQRAEAAQAAADSTRAATIAEIERALESATRRTQSLAGRANRTLSPLPVMTPGDEAALRQFRNATHVARGRALGVRASDEEAIDSLVAVGRLVPLADSTEYWIVRPGTSPTHVVPEVPRMLEELSRRFQARLAEMGVPPYRIEVTSALRTTEHQARLRRTNANAAAGVSAHEFGTTVDLSYAAFAPPLTTPAEILDGVPEVLVPHVTLLSDLSYESVSARKSRELTLIFSRVLREAQAEGIVVVTYERQQTVYHISVGPAYSD